jgi:hypothetical protein
MDQLKGMFPDYDEEILRSMIFQTKGHLERTIELLLEMEPPKPSKTVKNTSSDKSSGIGPSHNLPDDFLMYRSQNSQISTSVPKSTNNQVVQKPIENSSPTMRREPSFESKQPTTSQPSTFGMLSDCRSPLSLISRRKSEIQGISRKVWWGGKNVNKSTTVYVLVNWRCRFR